MPVSPLPLAKDRGSPAKTADLNMAFLSHVPKDVDGRNPGRRPHTHLTTEERAFLALKLLGTACPLEAEVIFYHDACVGAGITALRENGFDVSILPQRDPWTTSIWLRISVAECDGNFIDWVQGIVMPLGGDVLEADLPRRQPSPNAA